MATLEASTFAVPTRDEVTPDNQQIFDQLKGSLGFMPNLYAYLGKNETALGDYLTLQNRKSTLKAKEREVVNLVTSQINGCRYCQSAHTAIGKMNGFTDEQILEIRQADVSFDSKLEALATFTSEAVNNHGRVSEEAKEAFFAAGYTEANMIDVIVVIGDKIVANYIHNIAQFDIDFPVAPAL